MYNENVSSAKFLIGIHFQKTRNILICSFINFMILGPLKECLWKTFYLNVVKLRLAKSCCYCGDTLKLNLFAFGQFEFACEIHRNKSWYRKYNLLTQILLVKVDTWFIDFFLSWKKWLKKICKHLVNWKPNHLSIIFVFTFHLLLLNQN